MDQSPKQSIVEHIKSATNILVTVSRNPSVDALSAALALTLMLNKMEKHATAVFSGKIPSAIEFLEPSKTFEGTVDSLRDFIIALDKEKADRLRYKVEDDVVRIFITPYRTTISEKDLSFSQGDFNVELVIALGVERREELDEAIAAHGRILHDATVVTINDNGKKTGIGTIDWSDDSVSSLCEMLMSLSEALKSGLLDEQIASALLTGLVAATERFSNPHTSPRVMTMAAQLMAAGANQQLIAAKLEEGHVLPSVSQVPPAAAQTPASTESVAEAADNTKGDGAGGSLHISHDQSGSLPPVQPLVAPYPPAQPAPEVTPYSTPQPPRPSTYEEAAQDELARHIAPPAKPTFTVSDLQQDLAEAESELKAAAAPLSQETPTISAAKGGWRGKDIEPTFGGTLNATTDEAEEEKHREELSAQNHKLLDHASWADHNTVPTYAQEEPGSVDPFAEPPRAEPDAPMHYEATPLSEFPNEPAPAATPTPPPAPMPPLPEPPAPDVMDEPFVPPTAPAGPTLEEIEAQAKGMATPAASTNPLDDARAAVDAALTGSAGGFAPEPVPAAPTPPPAPAPSLGVPPPIGATPPLPDFSTLPPLPGDTQLPPPPVGPHVGMPEVPPQPPESSNDPGQFKIPGQP